MKKIQLYKLEENSKVMEGFRKFLYNRSKLNVKWASMEEPLHLIKDFEEIVDKAVNLLSFPLICAYEGKKMPDYLKTILLETHPYVLLEDDLIVSEEYQPPNVT